MGGLIVTILAAGALGLIAVGSWKMVKKDSLTSVLTILFTLIALGLVLMQALALVGQKAGLHGPFWEICNNVLETIAASFTGNGTASILTLIQVLVAITMLGLFATGIFTTSKANLQGKGIEIPVGTLLMMIVVGVMFTEVPIILNNGNGITAIVVKILLAILTAMANSITGGIGGGTETTPELGPVAMYIFAKIGAIL